MTDSVLCPRPRSAALCLDLEALALVAPFTTLRPPAIQVYSLSHSLLALLATQWPPMLMVMVAGPVLRVLSWYWPTGDWVCTLTPELGLCAACSVTDPHTDVIIIDYKYKHSVTPTYSFSPVDRISIC